MSLVEALFLGEASFDLLPDQNCIRIRGPKVAGSRTVELGMDSNFRPADTHLQRVDLSFEYPVCFCRDSLDPSDSTLAWVVARREPNKRHPVFFVVDQGVAEAFPDLRERLGTYVAAHVELEPRGEVMTVPGGEGCKNDPEVVNSLIGAFADARLDRHSVVIAIGGGAVLDVVGYAAALVHRGLRLVRIPTTVLSQNDAGVGVKNGVNARGAKNFLGTFAPPYAVLDDFSFLTTLGARDVRAGLAEAIKVAVIRDASFFERMEHQAAELRRTPSSDRPNPSLEEAIRRCALLHLEHIRTSNDPFEQGSARPLDYGHWAAHRLELMTEHELRHGEAVAIGMLLDARYAFLAGHLDSHSVERLFSLVARLGLPLFHPALQRTSNGRLDVLSGLDDFREHLGGALSVTLLTGIGSSIEVSEMSESRVALAISWLASEAESRTRPV